MARGAHNRLELIGQRFGLLTVIADNGVKKHPCGSSHSLWLCKCDCGNETISHGTALKSGNSTSCGCKGIERLKSMATHSMTGTKAYRTWQAMLNRCRNKGTIGFDNYGGRGIKVCSRWADFPNFINDMGIPEANQSIERVDNDGDYEPSNCKWATRLEQSRNKRSNRLITFRGETKILKDWAVKIGINQASLSERIEKWPLERALTEPKRR